MQQTGCSGCRSPCLPTFRPPPSTLTQVGNDQAAKNFTKFAGVWGLWTAGIAFYDGGWAGWGASG